ncbi:MAG TPA: spore germination protein [Selenomonadales bacterium]|nr:spore germination protein [Selenomonadales bacterium]
MTEKSTDNITQNLSRLKSLISESRQVEEDMENLISVLREEPASSAVSGALGWQERTLFPSLAPNITILKNIFYNCSDVVFHEFIYAQDSGTKLALLYIDGLADKVQVSEHILKPLIADASATPPNNPVDKTQVFRFILERQLRTHQTRETDRFQDVVNTVLSGDTVLLVDGHTRAIINGARGWENRTMEEPGGELVLRGPRDSFVETLRVNTAVLRRRIKSPDLKIEAMTFGRLTRTDVAVVYVKGVASENMVEEVKRRLGRIDIDAVLESGYIEELIEDNPWSLFPQINHTERPDRLAARLLEGRVGILVDGTPFALSVPSLFVEYLQAPDDYYERWQAATALRILRFVAQFLSLVVPSFYLAVITFHHEMLPTALLLNFAAQREHVPFPAFMEILLMEIMFEILREAGLRLPKAVGQAVSIVGALVLGETAVRTGLVGEATVIVVAVTGISSFLLAHSNSLAVRLLRFPLLLLSGFLGLFGLMIGLTAIFIHICSLRSFGVPYLSPLSPFTPSDQKDTLVRAPWRAILTRPHLIARFNKTRQTGISPAERI